MSEHAEHERDMDEQEERRIADYLAAHPSFFLRHRELLTQLEIPHDVAPAISLLEYQVEILRDDRRRLRARLDDLLRVARENDRVSEQLHRLTLELLEARGSENVLVALGELLRSDFRADSVEITLLGDALPELNIRRYPADGNEARRLRELFRGQRPVVGRLTGEQMQAAFGEIGAEMRSAAVIPLEDDPVHGLIAIGSHDPQRYRGDLGTVFLQRLGDLVARQLRLGLDGDG
ncbi:DUF484 family protein [Arhodomonas sp. AD133]|uniref:DUF484 family protein n=1 Tax=Arhodomonas sp. AD133 TaxID=3415009 RepID=UPI003EBC4B98